MIDHQILKTHTYGLVAAEHLHSLPTHIRSIRLAHDVLSDSAALMPSLIELGALTDADALCLLECMQAQIEAGEAPVVSSLLRTDYDVPRIQSHFAHVQVCRNPRGERAWLRVHDSRVWAQLPRVLQPNTYAQLCVPLQGWTIHYAGQWVSDPWATHPKEAAPYAPFSSLPLTAAEWGALERLGIVNRSLCQLGLTTYAQAMQHSATLDGLIAHAQTNYHLSRIDDLVNYATLGWHIHPRFDTHPTALQAIEQHYRQMQIGKLDDDASMVDSLKMALDPTQWPSMREALNSTIGSH